tara:strand:+ start:341 stop:475 length:135 start_codon:yes stop_codon:yes gene_type:complete
MVKEGALLLSSTWMTMMVLMLMLMMMAMNQIDTKTEEATTAIKV